MYKYFIKQILDKQEFEIFTKEIIRTAIVTSKSKFDFLRSLENNIFISNIIKAHVLDIFFKIQVMHNGFLKLSKIFILKKCLQYNTTDIHMTNITKDSKYVMQIKQNHFVYLFTRCDLINLLNNSLSYSQDFFVKSYICKNPYNNMEFSHACLHNIYYFLQDGDMVISPLIIAYYNNDFNLELFIDKNEDIIRSFSISSFVKNAHPKELRYYILNMIDDYSPDILIHETFCTEKLLKNMLKFLETYLMINYSFDRRSVKKMNEILLFNQLRKFKSDNPKFGRVLFNTIRIHIHSTLHI